ncbi:MAG: FmdB family zinc ribbon protein [Terriglobales bacterium]
MPLYEYECQRCHKRVEKIQSFSAEPLKVCAFCGGPLERLISASAIQFKGTGWYVTDYAHSNTSPAGSHEPKSDAAPSSGSDGKPTPSAPASSTPAAAKSSD